MAPTWEELGDAYENSKKVVIADVDCTADGNDALCQKYGVTGYPTLKYFTPPDTEGEVYEGGRELKDLKKCHVGSKEQYQFLRLEEHLAER